jgi:hypothetical protein
MAFLFRNKQKVVLDTTRSAKELLQKLETVDQLPPAVSALQPKRGERAAPLTEHHYSPKKLSPRSCRR